MLRASGKHELAKSIAIISDYDPQKAVEKIYTTNCNVVIDGGDLLHRIPWSENETYAQILNTYSTYLRKKYGDIQIEIVFDGYGAQSTKDMAHIKRSRIVGREVNFSPAMKLTTSKEEFLSCTKNKSKFLTRLGDHLSSKGFQIHHATGDADLLIVKTAIASSKKNKTLLIGSDTDLLCLLLHYSEEIDHHLYLKNEPKNGVRGKIWDIKQLSSALGKEVCKCILFAHAILGCDTTSKPYGIGKMKALELLTTDFTFQTFAGKFYEKNISTQEIVRVGERAMTIIYGGPIHEGIETLRYKTYQRKISLASSFVNPQELSPTSAALKFHSKRAYFQEKRNF